MMAVGQLEKLAPLEEDESPADPYVKLGAYTAHPDEGKCLNSVRGGGE